MVFVTRDKNDNFATDSNRVVPFRNKCERNNKKKKQLMLQKTKNNK